MDKLIDLLKKELEKDPNRVLVETKPLIEIRVVPIRGLNMVSFLDIIYEDTYREFLAKDPKLEYAYLQTLVAKLEELKQMLVNRMLKLRKALNITIIKEE